MELIKINFPIWSGSIDAGTYMVRVYVKNNLVPLYQYSDPSNAVINVR